MTQGIRVAKRRKRRAPIQGFKAPGSSWENSHPGPFTRRGRGNKSPSTRRSWPPKPRFSLVSLVSLDWRFSSRGGLLHWAVVRDKCVNCRPGFDEVPGSGPLPRHSGFGREGGFRVPSWLIARDSRAAARDDGRSTENSKLELWSPEAEPIPPTRTNTATLQTKSDLLQVTPTLSRQGGCQSRSVKVPRHSMR